MKAPEDMKPGTIHRTKYGNLEIIEYNGTDDIFVRFRDTGYETVTGAGRIRDGSVKDLLRPSVFGVGFIGCGNYGSGVTGNLTPQYRTWSGMIRRCYDDKYHKKRNTYRDCEVCEEWQDFQCFASWYDETHPGGDAHLDKDGIVKGNKIYGPDTCQWVSISENTEISKAKTYKFVSPEGETVDIYNLSKFCRENNLSQGNMNAVNVGKRNQHKGWRKSK